MRSDFAVPDHDGTLEIGGAVGRPTTLTLDDLRAMPAPDQVVTPECVGNGRLDMKPLPTGETSGAFAVPTARWTGALLHEVLAEVESRFQMHTGRPRPRVHDVVDMWATIANERGALAADLADLSGDQWATQSLCPDWTVHDALAHMTSTAHTTPPAFLLGMAGSGFSFEKFSRKGIDRWRGDSPAQALQSFREVQRSRKHPPGPATTWLGEAIVHAEDIRRPLGIRHAYPADAVRQALDFYKGSNALIGTKRRIDGVTLRATDLDWTHGSGPEARGPMLSLLLAGTGRRAALDDLTGDGVAVLRSRD